jgi:glycosyltransferase involved in cell wall biosynthesis
MGLERNIFFTGSKTQKETRELYLNSDIFLFTGVIAQNGDRDGIPNVVPEAMSAGCLVLASCYAGASEAFVEDVSGFSINPFNTKEWVDLLVEFWQSPQSFLKIRESAIRHSKEAFNIERTANSFSNAVLNSNLK